MTRICAWVVVTGLSLAAPLARAQFAVVDIAAIAQLVNQLRTLEDQLTQARDAFDSMTGERGMELLLAGTVRNYLPANWNELAGALGEAQGLYGELSAEIQAVLTANAILTPEQLAELPPAQRRELDAARQSAAMLQSLARQALGATSQRFEAIQTLIDAIPRAHDQKAILDLQARIGAEHDMLANDNTKLQVLFQTAQAEEWARHQREREQALSGIGSLRDLPPLGLAELP
ncbi:MAG: type IV secretion system protein [Pseudomonadota bacterium]